MKRVARAVLAVLALAGCRDENVETKLRAEPTPPLIVIAPHEPPVAKPRFVLVASGTPLRAEANESRITATLPEGGPPIVVFQVDAARPDDSAWIRLRTSPRGSDCGYPAHVVSEPVHVRRDELVRTPRADKTIAGPKPTSIVLRRGLALRPLNDEGRFMVTTPEARSKLRLPEVELTTELDEAMLTAAAEGTVGTAAPRADALRVGPHEIRLSKKRPPALSLLEGQPKISQLITPCLRVTGVLVDEEKEKLDRQVAAITSQLAAFDVELESIHAGSTGRPDFEALLDGPATGDLGSALATRPMRGEGGAVIGRGGGGRLVDLGDPSRAEALPPTKRSRVLFGPPRTDGTVDGSTIAATLRGQRPAFERCHAEASEERGTGPGRVLLEIALHPDGSVANVRSLPESQEIPDGTDLDDAVFIDCLRQKVRGMRFAQPENPMQIRITLAFAPPK